MLGNEVDYDKHTAANSQCREFMTDAVNHNDYIICICSNEYVKRYNKEGACEYKTGVANEGELISKRINNTKHPEDFLIVVVKHNTRKHKRKLPTEFPDVFWFDFDKPEEECGKVFSDLGKTIFKKELSLLQKQLDIPTIQKLRDRLEEIFTGLWISKPGSDDELEWYNKWMQSNEESSALPIGEKQLKQNGKKENNNQESSNNREESTQDDRTGIGGSTLWANMLGRWDNSYLGDREIIDELGGI